MSSITYQPKKFSRSQLFILSLVAASAVVLIAKPAGAQSQVATAVTEMEATMGALEGLAISGLAVALTPLGIRVGLRIIWHVLASA